MNKEDRRLQENLAHSLTAESTDLIPYLPYLLQDIDELGADVEIVRKLLKENTEYYGLGTLDLACGKGTVVVELAKEMRAWVKGIDMIPEFIEEAKKKAKAAGLTYQCHFEVGDANVQQAGDMFYDVTMLLAAGDILGDKKQTLQKLKRYTKYGGYIVLDDSYIKDEKQKTKYKGENYCTLKEYQKILKELGLKEIASAEASAEDMEAKNKSDIAAIEKRAAELIKKHPDKKALFESYVQSQKNEIDDLENNLVNLVQLIERID